MGGRSPLEDLTLFGVKIRFDRLLRDKPLCAHSRVKRDVEADRVQHDCLIVDFQPCAAIWLLELDVEFESRRWKNVISDAYSFSRIMWY